MNPSPSATVAGKLFPLFAQLQGRPVLVIGAGAVAARKIELLLSCGAEVRVVAAELGSRARAWQASAALQWIATTFVPAQLDQVWLVIAATSDEQLNAQVADAAEARRLWCNVVDRSDLCSFQSPAVIERLPLQIAVSSGGAAPVLARQIRERIEAMLEPSIGGLARLMHRWRHAVRRRLPQLSARRRFLEQLGQGPVGRFLAASDPDRAEQAMAQALQRAEPAPRGLVSLVGAGPGDPGLLTLKGLRRLQEADVILYDRLVSGDILALARRDAEFIETGKQAGLHHTTQAQIHALLLHHASLGRRVVRLKGGDPFVFGRGGEELEVLRAAGIDYEVVPGITAALACAAYAGIPLTHRAHAQSVRLLTAHCQASIDTLDWAALAADRQTLALYMGVGQLAQIRDGLLAHGKNPATPIALVENGSRPEQRIVLARLDELPQRAERFKVQSPALLIIGEVAALAARLHWFAAAPLGLVDAGDEVENRVAAYPTECATALASAA